MADDIPKYPLYDATYAAYRLSPLYHGSNPLLDETTLRMHARRLRDVLRGDILRGVDVGFASTETASSGALETCSWSLIGDEESWDRLHQQDMEEEREEPGDLTDAPSLSAEEARGVHVELRFQKATHCALLLRDPAVATSVPKDFTALPLLLVRMPAALRETFIDYLVSTFDARVAPMKLRSTFLSSTLESIISHLDASASIPSLPSVLRGLQLQLSFPSVFRSSAPPPLRSLDITLAKEDLPEFLSRGAHILADDPSILRPAKASSQPPTSITGPMTAALSHYLSAHLSLPLSHPAVTLSKIALSPLLALSADGKLKIFSPTTAAVAATSDTVTSDALALEATTSAIRTAVDAFYASLLRAAHTAPVADGIAASLDPVIPVRSKGKAKEKEKARRRATASPAAASSSGRARGTKRALGLGDANAKAGAGRRGRTAEASPKRRKGGRSAAAAVAEEGEDVDAEGEDDDDVLAPGATAPTAGRLTRMSSVPQEPPPPYELHDPAIAAGGTRR